MDESSVARWVASYLAMESHVSQCAQYMRRACGHVEARRDYVQHTQTRSDRPKRCKVGHSGLVGKRTDVEMGFCRVEMARAVNFCFVVNLGVCWTNDAGRRG